ncbi:MAG: phosphoenolpyruvate carboxylase, partial [Planctomycetaceae bacterium]|nr:phosphoenolpyruvate carboxylase [Planctomycetaceae bacterium]
MNKKQNELSGTIRLLGGLLGETIIAQEGREVFEMEEEIRKLAKAWRAGDAGAKQRLDEVIPSLLNDLPLAAANLKAFSTYFQLVNLAEERERVRILRERAETAFESNVPMDETMDEALGTLKREGVEASEIQEILTRMVVTPVFTAHPTESKRRTIRQILNKVSTLLKRLDSADLFAQERNEAEELLRDYIVLLWQSDETRNRRPTVMDEVRNSGLYFFENTLFDLVPRIYEELDAALVKHFPEQRFDVPSFLSYGSWIGGDRDGNPYVTTDVTEETLQEHEATVLSHYLKEVRSMYSLLSPSTTRVNFSHWFLASLEKDRELVPEEENEVLERFSQEPYRQKLIMIYRRLVATKKQNEITWSRVPAEKKDPRAYDSVDQFLDDLYLIRDSLLANQGERLVRGRFARLIRSAQVFGFHMASLDLRQHSKRHQ